MEMRSIRGLSEFLFSNFITHLRCANRLPWIFRAPLLHISLFCICTLPCYYFYHSSAHGFTLRSIITFSLIHTAKYSNILSRFQILLKGCLFHKVSPSRITARMYLQDQSGCHGFEKRIIFFLCVPELYVKRSALVCSDVLLINC